MAFADGYLHVTGGIFTTRSKNVKTDQKLLQNQELLNGPLPFSMCNDFLFKILLQDEDRDVLKAIICSYLDLRPDEIVKLVVTNDLSST